MTNRSLPRYVEIRRRLEAQIMSGELKPGDRVPSEHELGVQYGCARMTVNKAISALSDSGLIVRKRRSGSFVAMPKSQETVVKIFDLKAEITATGRAYRYDILFRKVRTSTVADMDRLRFERPRKVVALRVLHFADGMPFSLEDRLINLDQVPEAESEPFREQPPGTWLLSHIPWTTGENRIRAVPADRTSARLLKISKGSPCLLIERRTMQLTAPITQVRLCYPGDQHELVARFESPTRSK